MKYRAVCFDFDYTLGDSTDSIVAGFQYGFTRLGWPAPDRETVRGTVGYLLEDAYTLLTGDRSEEGRAAFRPLFRAAAQERQRRETRLDCLELVIGSDRVKRHKPDPEGLNAAMAAMGVSREELLFCGDTVIDAQAARNAGVDFAAVLNGTTPAPAFEPWPCVHIAPDLLDLRNWLGEQAKKTEH